MYLLESPNTSCEEVVGAGPEDEDDDIESWYKTHHFLYGVYPDLNWRRFYYETPLWWISNALEFIGRRIKHGYISNQEVMMTKAALRAQGATEFDK